MTGAAQNIVAEWVLKKPDDEPTQIACTGEAGNDVWQPAFGTWEADDFGLDSDEAVGSGERLFVNRSLYDAMAAALTDAYATIANLTAANAALAADNARRGKRLDEARRLIELYRGMINHPEANRDARAWLAGGDA